jgi:DNA-binding Lrp family transcriptional regulator
MKSIFVQIKCDLGRAYAVAAQLSDEFDNASQIYSTSGHYDLLVQFRLQDGQDPGLFINESLHRVPGIKDTYTIMVFDAFTPGAGSDSGL